MVSRGDKIVFTSGRSVYATGQIVGIDSDLYLTEGFDGQITDHFYNWNGDIQRVTADDMRELADIMIDRWTRYRASL